MIVCVCANVNTRAVEQAIQAGCETVESLTMTTGACSGCGQCRQMCQEMLVNLTQSEMAI